MIALPHQLMIAIPNYISPEEYLEIERQNPIRHEYRRGLVYAMAGGTDDRDRIFLKSLDLKFAIAELYRGLDG